MRMEYPNSKYKGFHATGNFSSYCLFMFNYSISFFSGGMNFTFIIM